MRKTILILLCVLIPSLLFGCTAKKTEPGDPAPEKPDPASDGGGAVVFVNGLKEADIWILPETEKNLKTTVWGTATIAKLPTDGEQRLSLDALGGPGAYILRMIDTNGMYYAVNGISLEDGYTLHIRAGEDPMAPALEVTDAEGAAVETYSGFGGRL